MSRYEKSQIYKLCCKDPNVTDFYVGSTSNFTRRKQEHKRCSTNKSNSSHVHYTTKLYKCIRSNGGFENWSMIQLLNYPCQNKREREMKEREFVELLKPSLNCCLPTLTDEERNNYSRDYDRKRLRSVQCHCGVFIRKHLMSKHTSGPKHRKLFGLKMEQEIEVMQKRNQQLIEICEFNN